MTTDVPSKNFRPGSRSEAAAPEIRLWKACAWCGPIYLAALGVFWAGVAGFVPPPGEDWSPQKIAAFFTDNEIRVRIGMVGVVVFALCYAVWAAAVARVMRRADGREHLLSTIQFVGGVGNAWVTMAVGALWLTASFRPSTRPSDQILLLNDLAWMVFVMPAMTLVLQIAAVGVWILRDHLSAPLMPRWVGYLSFWISGHVAARILDADLPNGTVRLARAADLLRRARSAIHLDRRHQWVHAAGDTAHRAGRARRCVTSAVVDERTPARSR
jgi:hypothetical protein